MLKLKSGFREVSDAGQAAYIRSSRLYLSGKQKISGRIQEKHCISQSPFSIRRNRNDKLLDSSDNAWRQGDYLQRRMRRGLTKVAAHSRGNSGLKEQCQSKGESKNALHQLMQMAEQSCGSKCLLTSLQSCKAKLFLRGVKNGTGGLRAKRGPQSMVFIDPLDSLRQVADVDICWLWCQCYHKAAERRDD